MSKKCICEPDGVNAVNSSCEIHGFTRTPFPSRTPKTEERCPNCGGQLAEHHHGPYCPKPTCKWGWEVEMDGSPLQPPEPAIPAQEGQTAEQWLHTNWPKHSLADYWPTPVVEQVIEAYAAPYKARVAALEGAMAADDERLRKAAEDAGLKWSGCDTPDALAEEILGLREELKRMREANATLLLLMSELLLMRNCRPYHNTANSFPMTMGAAKERRVRALLKQLQKASAAPQGQGRK